MATYAVDTMQLRACAEQLGSFQRELDSVAMRLTGFQMGSTLQMRGSTVLMAQIGDCKWATISRSEDLGRMSRGLADVSDLYERYERELTEPRTQAQAERTPVDEDLLAELMEYFPILEAIGFGIESLGRLVWELGDVFSNVVGYVMSGIESILDNVEEFSDNLFSGQFLFELVGEAAVDTGIGIGVGLAAIAIFGTPVTVLAALGISAFTAIVCWGGDCICRWFSGDDISELIVDFAWDTIEWVGDGVEALWNGAGEFLDTILPW